MQNPWSGKKRGPRRRATGPSRAELSPIIGPPSGASTREREVVLYLGQYVDILNPHHSPNVAVVLVRLRPRRQVPCPFLAAPGKRDVTQSALAFHDSASPVHRQFLDIRDERDGA